MVTTTTDFIPGKEILDVLGIARGSTVRARNIGNDIFAGLKNIIGGEINEYTKLQAQSREQALQRMIDDQVLTKFIFEDRRYKPDELVGIVKRIKEWGSTSSEEEVEYVDS